ncbi:MAG: hypothetical protein ACJ8H8_01045 [Geminicoccaceae bacterium]
MVWRKATDGEIAALTAACSDAGRRGVGIVMGVIAGGGRCEVVS